MTDPDFETLLRAKFLEEAGKLLASAAGARSSLNGAAPTDEELAQLYRVAHNWKSGALTVGFSQLGAFAGAVEALLAALRRKELVLSGEVASTLRTCFGELEVALETLRGPPGASPRFSVSEEELRRLLPKAR